MAAPHRTVVVMRHAKAEAVGATDLERELSPSGRRDALAAGEWLAAQGIVPDCALVSAATRTRQTWQQVVSAAGWDLEPDFDPGLYAADPDTALDLVRALPDDSRVALVVGHNPAVASLAQLLDDGEGDVEAGNQMALGFPTTAMAVFTFDGAWAELGPGTASITAYQVCRG